MLLKNGSTGDLVKQLQTKLGLTPDGAFGPGTEKAVKEWQAKNGLTADGIVGEQTMAKMGITLIKEDVVIPPSSFKLENLKGHIPEAVIAQIPDTAAKFNITTPLRLAHFLAQCGHESGGFKLTTENLYYPAASLSKVWPTLFPATIAESYSKQPEKIANRAYGNRMGNGDETSGDGYKFRGRGFIQLTGKNNYTNFTKFIGEDCVANPDLVATKYPLAAAAFFFNNNGLWSVCDKGADEATVTAVTKRVNGGILGLQDRVKHFNEYYSLLK